MANLKDLRYRIFKFLERKEPQVIAIKGDWGVGKTCAWRNALEEAAKVKEDNSAEEKESVEEEKYKKEIHEDFKNYSYISLFGIDSIDELRFSILEKSENKKSIGNKVVNKKELFKKFFPVLKEAGSNFKLAKSIIKFGETVGQAFSYSLVRNAIICLDDLERTELDMRKILGVISELKEEKECKVVLIFNEDKLQKENESAQDRYIQYREKVIDIEINFTPTAKECAVIGFDDKKETVEPDGNVLRNACCQLEIKNIRTMNRIIQLWEELPDLEQDVFDTVKDRIALVLVFVSQSFYEAETSKDKEIDTLSEKLNNFLNDTSENNFLSLNHLKGMTNLDKEILHAVNEGDFDEEDFNEGNFNIRIKEYINDFEKRKRVLEQNDKLIKVSSNYRKAGEKLHSNFNDEKVIDDIYEAAFEYITEFPENFNIDELNGAITILRNFLKNNEKISTLINLYVENRTDGGYERLKELSNFVEFDDELKEAVLAKQKNNSVSASLDEVLLHLSSNSSCSDEYKLIIDNSSQDDYYEAFKKIEYKKMYAAIKHCLAFANEIGKENINQALNRLAGESKINALRVKNIRRLS